MKHATKFSFSPSWKVLLNDMGIDIPYALKLSGLPADLFQREQATFSANEYFTLFQAIVDSAPEKDVPLVMAQHMSAEAFDPAFFAALCSPNFSQAVKRIAQYKPLIGPMKLSINETSKQTTITISCYGTAQLPAAVGLCELVFFTQLFRIATRKRISPTHLTIGQLPESLENYQQYFGQTLTQDETTSLTFSHQDMTTPFVTQNHTMWQFFEDRLNQQLADLQGDAKTAERARSVLLEAIPSGDCTIENVASLLHISKRTLQRKLAQEQTNYKDLLQQVRTELADHYLLQSRLPLAEISFLLGFQETNSFIRAYQQWKGVSPTDFRTQHH